MVDGDMDTPMYNSQGLNVDVFHPFRHSIRVHLPLMVFQHRAETEQNTFFSVLFFSAPAFPKYAPESASAAPEAGAEAGSGEPWLTPGNG